MLQRAKSLMADSLRQKEEASRVAYIGQVVYLCCILILLFSIIALVFGWFDEQMSFLTLFGSNGWQPVDRCVSTMKYVLFNVWTLLLLYTALLIFIACLPLYVSIPPHWLPYDLWLLAKEA